MTLIHYDNKSFFNISKNLEFHERSKHIETKYCFIREMLQKGEVKLQHISIDDKNEDILTKPLCRLTLVYFRDKLDMM